MEDLLFKKLFLERWRWDNAIKKGLEKGIDRYELHEMSTIDWQKQFGVQLLNRTYNPAPPHMAEIPKDEPGKFRTVVINENKDRVINSMFNDLYIDVFKRDMIHPHCTSYLPGVGTGKIVTWISKLLVNTKPFKGNLGWKADLTKYFDSVPLWAIDDIFRKMEMLGGKSCIIDASRRAYHDNLCFDLKGNLVERYQSLKQGCAVASFLADALLYDMDAKLTEMAELVGGCYYRYSDDCLYIGRNYEEAMRYMQYKLNSFELTLNPKKVEYIQPGKWFKFLGWLLKDDKRTPSSKRTKNIQKELYNRTMGAKASPQKALNAVNRYFYKGDYCLAKTVLGTMNVEEDIEAINSYAMDCIRCCMIKRYKHKDIGGLGVELNKSAGTITRGKGDAIKTAMERTPKEIPGYYTLVCMRKNLLTDRAAFETVARGL